MSGKTENPMGEFFRTVFGVVFVIVFLGGMLWAFGYLSPFGLPGMGGSTTLSDDTTREVSYVEPEVQAPLDSPPVSAVWSCDWSPTMDEDWHDDILCIKGSGSLRPSLLEDWDFVTQADMMQAAAEFEVYLNSTEGTTSEDGVRAPVFTGP